MTELAPYLRLLAAYRGRLALGTVLMAATVASSVGLLGLAGWFITATGVTAVAVAAGAAMTLDVYTPGAGIRAFALTRTAARYGERVLHHDAVLGVLAALRARVFAALTRLDPATAAHFGGGEVLNRLTSDIDALDQLYLRSLAPPAVAVLAVAGLGGGVALVDPGLGLALALGLLAGGAAITVALALAGHRRGAALVARGERLRRDTLAALAGLAELRAFGTWARERERLTAASAAQIADQERLTQRAAAGEAAVTLAVQGAAAGALAAGLTAYAAGARTLAVAVLVPLAVLGLGEILGLLPGGAVTLGRTRAAAARLNRQLAAEPVVAEPAEPAPAPAGNALALERVAFRHGPLADPVLDGADLVLAPGETVAVTGASGSGKSTLADLCARLADPQAGRVCLGGTDVRALATGTLRSRLAYLRQRGHLFAETVAENLRLAAPDADDAALWHVLWRVGLDETIAARPHGLETWLGSGGAGLSGGQARRLELARVWLADRPVSVLDEPFAGLDAATAATVAERLFTGAGDGSTLILAHEATPLPPVDRKLELAGGRLAPVEPARA